MPTRLREASFGQVIRARRMEANITLRDFAKKLEVSPTYVSQIEQGNFNPPSGEKIIQIAGLLKMDADDLFALAGKVAPDLPTIIHQHPREMASFLRTADGMSAMQIQQVTKYAQRLKGRET